MPKDNLENHKRMIEESIVETVREPLIVLDANLKVISANKSFYRIFKVSPKETQGRLIYDLGNRQWNIPKLRKLLEEILPKSTTIENYEVEHDFKTIGPKTMLLNARRLDSMQMILLAIEDITERNLLKNELLQVKGEEFKVIFDNAADGILIADLEGKKFHQGNNAICRMLGYSKDEIKSLGITDIHPKKDLPNVIDQFERQIKGEFTLSRDLPVKRKDGSVFYVDVNATTIKIAGKIYLMGFFHDTTERKKAEDELKKAAAEWKNTFDSISDMIFIMDRNSTILRANLRFAEAVKMKPEEISGKKCYHILHKSGKRWTNCPFEKTLKDGKTHTEEIDDPVIGVPLMVTTSPTFSEKGELTGAVHVARDITKMRKANETAMKRNDDLERFEKLSVGRELKMIELKKKIRELDEELRKKQKV